MPVEEIFLLQKLRKVLLFCGLFCLILTQAHDSTKSFPLTRNRAAFDLFGARKLHKKKQLAQEIMSDVQMLCES